MANHSEPNPNVEKKVGFATVLVPVAGILALVLVVLGFVRANHTDSHGHSTSSGAASGMATARKIGEPISDFELRTLDGKTTKLSEIQAKVILINFWATWCGPCVQEMPSLQKLSDAYRDQGLVVLGVSLDDDPEKVLGPFLEKHSIRFPIYVDPEGNLADLFQVSGLPLTFVVDHERRLLFEQVGDEEWFNPDFRKQFELWLKGENG